MRPALLPLLALAHTRSASAPESGSVVHAPCYILGSVQLGLCDTGSPWDTYTVARDAAARQWSEHTGLNCYDGGHGATTLPERFPNGVSSKSTTLAGCKASCESQAACVGIVFASFSPIPPAPPAPIPFDPTEQIAGPPEPADAAGVAAWRETLVAWRAMVKRNLSYTGAIYEAPALAWTQTSYIQPQ